MATRRSNATTDGAFDDLSRTAEALTGQRLSAAVLARFQRYLELLQLWNRTHRLTGLRGSAEIVRGLFEDSLLFFPLLPSRPVRMLDVGAGAGIPGLPLKLVDDGILLTLVESRRKPVSFLNTVKRELAIEGLTIVEGRAETVCGEITARSGYFDVVVARSVAFFDTLATLAMPYLKVEGVLIASGSPAGGGSEQPRPMAQGTRVEYVTVRGRPRRRFLVLEKAASDMTYISGSDQAGTSPWPATEP